MVKAKEKKPEEAKPVTPKLPGVGDNPHRAGPGFAAETPTALNRTARLPFSPPVHFIHVDACTPPVGEDNLSFTL